MSMLDNDEAKVRLEPVLDLTAAAPLARELLSLRGRDLQVDASAVGTLGGQCLQVLLSAQATWEAEGKAFRVHGPSPEFSSAAALLGARFNHNPELELHQ